MKIGVVGLWHLGEIYSACLADLGHDIVGIDENRDVVDKLHKAIAPLAEPKLEEMLKRNMKKGRLKFTTDFTLLADCDVMWTTVDTPIDKQNKANTNKIFAHIKKTLPYLKNGMLLIVSSQLPVGSFTKIATFIKAHRKNFTFDYAYVPENLRLGSAVDSFMKPSRIVIGIDNEKRKEDLLQIFRKLKTNIRIMNVASAEMVKHATNAYLATSLSFIYDIADVCERVGADVTEVSRGLRADGRIGEGAYLDASAGFSGGHLERDLHYLRNVAKSKKINLPVITAVVRKNNARRRIVFEKITPHLGTWKDKTIAFFGITYKHGTPTLAHSLPMTIAKEAWTRGANVHLCDPWVKKRGIMNDPYEAAKRSHVIICITPWLELKKLDFRKLARLMTSPKIFFDGRNYFLAEEHMIKEAGILYIGVGR